MEWEEVSKQYETKAGEKFRISVGLRSPYDVKTVNKVISALRTGAGLVDASPFKRMAGYWIINNIEADPETSYSSVPMNGGLWENWTLRIEATRYASGTSIVVVVGLILAVLVALGGLILVTGWTVEKLKDNPINNLWSLGTILAVFIVIMTFARGKHAR